MSIGNPLNHQTFLRPLPGRTLLRYHYRLTRRHLKHASFLSLRPLPPSSSPLAGIRMQKEPGQCSPPPEPEHNRERGKNSRPERTGNAGDISTPHLFPHSSHLTLSR